MLCPKSTTYLLLTPAFDVGNAIPMGAKLDSRETKNVQPHRN
jgi:hypothetical protein